MTNENLTARLCRGGVVPVVTIEDVDAALPLADALLEGGLSVVEITFRAAAAASAIERLARERPLLLVGAGRARWRIWNWPIGVGRPSRSRPA